MASLRTQRFTQVRRFARVLACCLCVRALVRAFMHEYCHARRLRAVVSGGLHHVSHRSVVAHLLLLACTIASTENDLMLAMAAAIKSMDRTAPKAASAAGAPAGAGGPAPKSGKKGKRKKKGRR